jgi:hypothetical protein
MLYFVNIYFDIFILNNIWGVLRLTFRLYATVLQPCKPLGLQGCKTVAEFWRGNGYAMT